MVNYYLFVKTIEYSLALYLYLILRTTSSNMYFHRKNSSKCRYIYLSSFLF